MSEVPQTVPLARDCFVFVPGAGGGVAAHQKIELLTRRIATALDKHVDDSTIEFPHKIRTLEEPQLLKGEVGTIYRLDDQGERPVLDIYMLDYRRTLIERFENRNLLVKALLLLLALPGSLARIVRAMVTGKSSKTRQEKIQMLYAIGILFLLILYVVILMGAVVATIEEWNALARVLPDTKLSDLLGRFSWFAKLSQTFVVLSAVFLLFMPPKFNLKERISQAAVDYLCLVYYLNLGEQRNAIIGQLEALIDEISRISEKERKQGSGSGYRHIHLFAYSFGSIIALDALFPAGKAPGRPLRHIHTLVTIGCPFDFVRTFWSAYFDARRGYEKNRPVRWLNVYSPLDVLGSNFRNDSTPGDAVVNIRARETGTGEDVPIPYNVEFDAGLQHSELSFYDSLTLLGLRAHSMYWSSKAELESNCFDRLMGEMYDGR